MTAAILLSPRCRCQSISLSRMPASNAEAERSFFLLPAADPYPKGITDALPLPENGSRISADFMLMKSYTVIPIFSASSPFSIIADIAESGRARAASTSAKEADTSDETFVAKISRLHSITFSGAGSTGIARLLKTHGVEL